MTSPPPASRPASQGQGGGTDQDFADLVPDAAKPAGTPAPDSKAKTKTNDKDQAATAAAPSNPDDPAAATATNAVAPAASKDAATDALAALLATAGVTVPGTQAEPAGETSADPATTEIAPDPKTQGGDAIAAPIATAVPAPVAVIVGPPAEGDTDIAIDVDGAPKTTPSNAAAFIEIIASSETEDAPLPGPADAAAKTSAATEVALDSPERKSEPKADAKPTPDPKAFHGSDAAAPGGLKTGAANEIAPTDPKPAPDAATTAGKAGKAEDGEGSTEANAKAEANPKPDAASKQDSKRGDRTPAADAAPITTLATSDSAPRGDAASIVQLTPAATHASPHALLHATPENSQATAQTAAISISAVPMEIAGQAREGKTRFEIRLDPPELGRIDVRLDVDRHGQVTSRLTVERVETLDLLRRDAPQLERALQDAGLKTGDGALQFSLRQHDNSGRDQQQPQHREHYALVDETIQLPETAARLYGRGNGAGGIDIRV